MKAGKCVVEDSDELQNTAQSPTLDYDNELLRHLREVFKPKDPNNPNDRGPPIFEDDIWDENDIGSPIKNHGDDSRDEKDLGPPIKIHGDESRDEKILGPPYEDLGPPLKIHGDDSGDENDIGPTIKINGVVGPTIKINGDDSGVPSGDIVTHPHGTTTISFGERVPDSVVIGQYIAKSLGEIKEEIGRNLFVLASKELSANPAFPGTFVWWKRDDKIAYVRSLKPNGNHTQPMN